MIDKSIFPTYIAPFVLSQSDLVEGESNVSVIAKIAWKYRVKPAHVVRYLFQNNRHAGVGSGADIAVSANSITAKTLDVSNRIKLAAGLADFVGSYTYLQGFLDRGAHGLISQHKKWCSCCYKESMEKSVGSNIARVADQLYWSLDIATHCVKHLCTLSDRCGKCYQRQPYISSIVEPGFCHYCFASLAHAPAVRAEGEEELLAIKAKLYKYDVFYPELLGQKLNSSLVMKNLAKNLRALIEFYGDGGAAQIAFRCGVSEHTLKDWSKCRQGISLESLLALIKGFDLEYASDLFVPPEQFSELLEKQFSGNFNFRSRQSRRSVIPDIVAYFKRVFAGEEKPESRVAIAKRFGVSKGMLENAFKKELVQMSQLYAEQKEAETLRVRDRLQFEMNKAVRRCGSRNRPFDWAHIWPELGDFESKGVTQRDLELAKEKAVRHYIDSEKRDPTRGVKRLICDDNL